jgi:hypothetical protein
MIRDQNLLIKLKSRKLNNRWVYLRLALSLDPLGGDARDAATTNVH